MQMLVALYLILQINNCGHHQHAPVLARKESAINKYDWATVLERLFHL
jgi:hypothetical protein